MYGPKGKPALANPSGINFNITHAGNLAVIALTVGCDIGVDMEEIRPMMDMREIAARFFCPEEAAEIMSLPQAERSRAFFCCWTRKEAYIKATGAGLSTPLSSFRVTVYPDSVPRFVHLAGNAGEVRAWALHDLRLADGYSAALAYRNQPRSLSFRHVAQPTEFLAIS